MSTDEQRLLSAVDERRRRLGIPPSAPITQSEMALASRELQAQRPKLPMSEVGRQRLRRERGLPAGQATLEQLKGVGPPDPYRQLGPGARRGLFNAARGIASGPPETGRFVGALILNAYEKERRRWHNHPGRELPEQPIERAIRKAREDARFVHPGAPIGTQGDLGTRFQAMMRAEGYPWGVKGAVEEVFNPWNLVGIPIVEKPLRWGLRYGMKPAAWGARQAYRGVKAIPDFLRRGAPAVTPPPTGARYPSEKLLPASERVSPEGPPRVVAEKPPEVVVDGPSIVTEEPTRGRYPSKPAGVPERDPTKTNEEWAQMLDDMADEPPLPGGRTYPALGDEVVPPTTAAPIDQPVPKGAVDPDVPYKPVGPKKILGEFAEGQSPPVVPTEPITPSLNTPPEDVGGIMKWFADFLRDPKTTLASETTQAWRTVELSRRATRYEERLKDLLGTGLGYDDAQRQALGEFGGVLPSAKTGISSEFISFKVKDALFRHVRSLKKAKKWPDGGNFNSFDEIGLLTALRKALAGDPINIKVVGDEVSAMEKLQRAFPEDIFNALNEPGTLGNQIEKKMVGPREPWTPRPFVTGREPIPTQLGFGEAPGGLGALPTPEQFGLPGMPAPTGTTDELRLALARGPTGIGGEPTFWPPSSPALRAPEGMQLRLGEEAYKPLSEVNLPRDPRSAATREMDIAVFKLSTEFEAPKPGWAKDMQARFAMDDIDKTVAEQLYLMPPKDKNTLGRALKAAGLTGVDAGNLVRANASSVDFSWWRQVAPLIFGNLEEFMVANAKSFKALWSEDYANKIMKGIYDDPDYAIYQKMKLEFLREMGSDAGKAAEEFVALAGERPIQRFARKFMPWLGISARAHVTGVNVMTWRIFKGHLKMLKQVNEQAASEGMLKRIGTEVGGYLAFLPRELAYKPARMAEEFSIEKHAETFGRMLGDFSGRGIQPGWTKGRYMTPAISSGLFSFRMLLGRLFTPKHLVSSDPLTRKLAWRNLSTFLAGFSGMLLAGEKAGFWEVDKRHYVTRNGKTIPNSDFMKARIGPIRIDPWGGMQQIHRFYMALAPVMLSGSEWTRQYPFRREEEGLMESPLEYRKGTPEGILDLPQTLLEYKLSPMVNALNDLYKGTDFKGEKVSFTDPRQLVNRIAPFALMDMYEAFEEGGWPRGGVGPVGVVGGGVIAYNNPESVAQDLFGVYYDQLDEKYGKKKGAKYRSSINDLFKTREQITQKLHPGVEFFRLDDEQKSNVEARLQERKDILRAIGRGGSRDPGGIGLSEESVGARQARELENWRRRRANR